jgi:hypothetical protein
MNPDRAARLQAVESLPADSKQVLQDRAREISNLNRAPIVDHSIDDGFHRVESPNGFTTAKQRGDSLQITDTQTSLEGQGKGEGTARIQKLADYANDNGLRFVSDTKVSQDAAGVWNRLAQKGYKVVKNPNATLEGNDWVSDDTRRIFSIQKAASQATRKSGNVLTLGDVKSYATKNGMSSDQALHFLGKAGYMIQ